MSERLTAIVNGVDSVLSEKPSETVEVSLGQEELDEFREIYADQYGVRGVLPVSGGNYLLHLTGRVANA